MYDIRLSGPIREYGTYLATCTGWDNRLKIHETVLDTCDKLRSCEAVNQPHEGITQLTFCHVDGYQQESHATDGGSLLHYRILCARSLAVNHDLTLDKPPHFHAVMAREPGGLNAACNRPPQPDSLPDEYWPQNLRLIIQML